MTEPGKRKPHFLFVSAPFGGIEVFFRNLQARIAGNPCVRTSWLFLDWNDRGGGVGIPVIKGNMTVRFGTLARRRIQQIESSGEPFDAVVFNHITLPSFLRRFRRVVPSVLSIDVTPILLDRYGSMYKQSGRGLSGPERWLKSAFVDRSIYRDARYLLAWSSLTRDSLINDYGVDEDRVMVIPPGVDLGLWDPDGPAQAVQRNHRSKPRILFVGGEFERKGGQEILALADHPKFRSCEFMVVTRSHVPTVPTNVRLLQGINANSSELRDLFRTSDIFLFPTLADFTPNVLCEAMAMRLPVLTTAVGGIPEMVVDGKTGVLVQPGDLTGLVRSLELLLDDAQLRKTMGEEGRRHVAQSYDIEKNAARIMEYLMKACNWPSVAFDEVAV